MGFDTSKIIANLKAQGGKAQGAAARAGGKFGLIVNGDAQELAPVDTGALKASATDEPAAISGGKITKVIGFNVNYAAAVHERLDVKHAQGEAKYLYTAMKVNQPKMGPYIA